MLARVMESMAATTQLVREKTAIPVPRIYGWSATDEEVGAPYMLMDWVEGVSFGDCLQTLEFEKTVDIIYQWATYVWELTRLQFPSIGCLRPSSSRSRVHVKKYLSQGSVDQGRDRLSLFRGPFSSVSDYLYGISNLKKSAPADGMSFDRFSFGTYLESFIPYALRPSLNKGPFVLCHDDFNVQNLLIDPVEGRITAVIDWDFAAVKPLQSLLGFPESLRWDLLAPYTPTPYEDYQIEWSRKFRPIYAHALLLASRNIDTGLEVDVEDLLEDSPFYAQLERGLGEAWREGETMKFCGGLIYGANSGDMLRWAAQSMRLGPWMKAYGRKTDLTSPIDAGFNESSVPPKPILPPPASATAAVKWEEPVRISKAPTHSSAIDTPKKIVKRCEWREKFLQRKRLRRIFGRLCRNSSDDSLGLKVRMIEKPTVVKKGRWWTLLGRRS
jgi:Phosphotransferase enzyme family